MAVAALSNINLEFKKGDFVFWNIQEVERLLCSIRLGPSIAQRRGVGATATRKGFMTLQIESRESNE